MPSKFVPGIPKLYAQVLCVGNSLVRGDQGVPYPIALATLLAGSRVRMVQNLGINGRSTSQLVGTDFATQRDRAFGGYYNIASLWEVTNDIWFGYSTTAAQARANLQALAALWKSIGCKVIVADVIARVDFSAPQRAAATQFNAELAADHSFADGYVCASTTFPDFTDESKFFTDHLHLNTNGYALRAALEAPEVLRLVSTFPAA